MSPSKFSAGGADKALPVIFAPSGPVLTDPERSFFAEANPLGFILFNKPGARNIENPDQVRRLCDSLRAAVGRDCPILTDQEGGRVQRLRPPHWRAYPPMRHFGELAEAGRMDEALEQLRFVILQMAEELAGAGINVTCAPVLDVLQEATHDVIGDRAFSARPEIAGRLGVSVCRNLLAAGVVPVIKHLPGHGRAVVDSHKDLPRVGEGRDVLDKIDFEPFRIVSKSDVASGVWGMVAHIVYDAIDPDLPSSISPEVIGGTVRGAIGFEGLLLSDDLDMGALAAYGDVGRRAALCLEAGCDVALQCSGALSDMEKVAKSVPKISEKALKRLQMAADFPKIAA